MSTISISDIQRDPVGWLKRVEVGESLLVVVNENPVAKISPVPPRAREPRPFGLCAGEFVVPDDFNAPLPEDVLRDFDAP